MNFIDKIFSKIGNTLFGGIFDTCCICNIAGNKTLLPTSDGKYVCTDCLEIIKRKEKAKQMREIKKRRKNALSHS